MTALIITFLLALLPPSASALTTSEQALRFEDKSEGNVLLGAEEAVIERGEIYKTVVLLWGRLDVHGEVDEVVVLSGHVTFFEGSKVNKSLVVMGGSFESKPGAGVKPETVVAKEAGPLWRLLRSAGNIWRDHISWIVRAAAGVVSMLLAWLLGWAVFAGFPGLQQALTEKFNQEWPQNLAVGFLGSFLVPVVFILLLVSIIGILFLPFYLMALGVFALLSYAAAALWAGHRLLPPKAGKKLNPLGFLLGLLAFQLLWMLPAWGSAIPVLVLWTLAWGALLRSLKLLWK